MKSLRWIYRGLVLATAAALSLRLWDLLRTDGVTPLEYLYLALVAVLAWWISASFWLAALGAYGRWFGLADTSLRRPPDRGASTVFSHSRTALLFPVRNEELVRLFAGIDAVRDSVHRIGASDKFDIFVLSDSNSQNHLIAEAEGCRALNDKSGCEVYYRYRRDNAGRKSGNIAEFCRNWGAQYDYMIVLDADSLMTGETLVRLVALMDVNLHTALIQAVPQLAGRESLFARIQQFSASVYGPIYVAGLSLLQGPDGNYWGHNAIIRIRAFMRHCGLPSMPGPAPFGGEFMSHDFVEAALLRRAGWNVHLVADMDGSFEEPPPTLIDYLVRDRRWCQGNLQHLRLLAAQGFHLESKAHFVTGVMSYLSSPLWLLMLIVSAVVTLVPAQDIRAPSGLLASQSTDIALLIAAMLALLFVPKLLGLALSLRDPDARRSHGGGWGLVWSVLSESLFSALLAPIMMVSQTASVMSFVLGEVGGWGVQMRNEMRASLGVVTRAFGIHTFLAALCAAVLVMIMPASVGWFIPVLVGPLLSIPLAVVTSSTAAGRFAFFLGLFVTPAEVGHVPIVARVREAVRASAITEQPLKANPA